MMFPGKHILLFKDKQQRYLGVAIDDLLTDFSLIPFQTYLIP